MQNRQRVCIEMGLVLTCGYSVLDVFWVSLHILNFNGGMLVFLTLVTATRLMLPAWEVSRYLREREVDRQASQLSNGFDCVTHARCSNGADERRIRQAIEGMEDEVNAAIDVLMRAGAYSQHIVRADSLGLNIRHSGHADLLLLGISGFTVWLLTVVNIGLRSIDFEHRAWAWAPVFSMSVVSVVAVVPVVLAVCYDWKRLTLIHMFRAWSAGAVCALAGLFLTLGMPHIVNGQLHGRFHLAVFNTLHVPPPIVLDVVMLWPALCAIGAVAYASLGPGAWPSAVTFARTSTWSWSICEAANRGSQDAEESAGTDSTEEADSSHSEEVSDQGGVEVGLRSCPGTNATPCEGRFSPS